MIKKIKYFVFPICEAKNAKQIIEAKKRCLENDQSCNRELLTKLEKEMKDLPEDIDKLEELIDREMERKRIIENKCQSFLGIISLIGIILALLFNLIKSNNNTFYTVVLSFLIFFGFVYVILSINTVFYILSEINIVYEKPLSRSDKELKRVVLLNRYQNLLRTNYLNTIYSNIKRFFFMLLIIFLFNNLSVIKNNLTAYNSGHTATLRSAQIQSNGWTSHVRNTLSVIALLKSRRALRTLDTRKTLSEMANTKEVKNGIC